MESDHAKLKKEGKDSARNSEEDEKEPPTVKNVLGDENCPVNSCDEVFYKC